MPAITMQPSVRWLHHDHTPDRWVRFILDSRSGGGSGGVRALIRQHGDSYAARVMAWNEAQGIGTPLRSDDDLGAFPTLDEAQNAAWTKAQERAREMGELLS